MHHIWSTLDETVEVYVTDELHSVLIQMERYFAVPDVRRALEDKLHLTVFSNFHSYQSLLKQFDKVVEPRDHILHMDLVRGNVLFDVDTVSPWRIDDVSISGIIDFEKAATGHRVFDIARTLAFLLVDCASKDRSSIYRYFLHSGYNKRGKCSFERNETIVGIPAHEVLNKLIGFLLLHDLYKFLKHTPYESLESNHHFIRTRDILIDYGMIRLVKTDKT